MTRPSVLVEMYLHDAWREITGFVHLPSGITVTRGRDNEQGTPSPGTLTFSVENGTRGEFVINGPNANWPYNAFARWTPVRYSVNGVRRFTGLVSSAPATWRSDQLSYDQIVCTDLLGMMAMSPTVDSWARELVGDMVAGYSWSSTPSRWWPLDDPGGSTQGSAAVGGSPLTASVYVAPGSNHTVADAIQFGQSADATTGAGSGIGGFEADTQLKIVSDGTDMRARMQTGTLSATSGYVSAMLVFTPDDTLGADDFFTITAGGRSLRLGIAGGLYIVDGEEDSFFHEEFSTSRFRAGEAALIGVEMTPDLVEVRFNREVFHWDSPRTISSVSASIGYRSGVYSHLVIVPWVIDPAVWESLLSRLMGQGAAPVTAWLKRACTAAGITSDPVATLDRTMERPALKGSNPAAIAETLASSCGGMCVADRNGVLSWIDPNYCPPVVYLTEPFTSEVRWDADASLYYTDVQVDGVKKASSPTNTFPRKSREVPGLLPAIDQANYVGYLANAADVWGQPRLAGFAVNLYPLDSDRTAAYLGLDLRSRVKFATLPYGMPVPMISTVEGYTETVTATDWTLRLNTAPDPSLVWEDDETVWESEYRISAL